MKAGWLAWTPSRATGVGRVHGWLGCRHVVCLRWGLLQLLALFLEQLLLEMRWQGWVMHVRVCKIVGGV
jgi:hypothetical protein